MWNYGHFGLVTNGGFVTVMWHHSDFFTIFYINDGNFFVIFSKAIQVKGSITDHLSPKL